MIATRIHTNVESSRAATTAKPVMIAGYDRRYGWSGRRVCGDKKQNYSLELICFYAIMWYNISNNILILGAYIMVTKAKTKQKVAGYVRVSSVGQVTGTGYDRQQKAIQAYIDKNGLDIENWYKEAHTGTEADRPAFESMIEDLLGNGADIIIIESLDRLARDLSVQLQLVAYLASKGLTLISANTGQDITEAMRSDPMQRAMVQIQGVFAELDKSLLVNKLRKARKQIRDKTGTCEGRKPYGYYPDEDKDIGRIKQLYRKPKGSKRLGFYRIAKALNEEGITTRMNRAWTGVQVRKILER